VNRAALVVPLAPIAPPCFGARDHWLTYLEAAAIEQRFDHNAGPLIFEPGRPVRFNPNFSYCEDCDHAYRSAMLKAGRCDREFVMRQYAQERAVLLWGVVEVLSR
jgi:hypothetical protein